MTRQALVVRALRHLEREPLSKEGAVTVPDPAARLLTAHLARGEDQLAVVPGDCLAAGWLYACRHLEAKGTQTPVERSAESRTQADPAPLKQFRQVGNSHVPGVGQGAGASRLPASSTVPRHQEPPIGTHRRRGIPTPPAHRPVA
jgi:hypothetical protein